MLYLKFLREDFMLVKFWSQSHNPFYFFTVWARSDQFCLDDYWYHVKSWAECTRERSVRGSSREISKIIYHTHNAANLFNLFNLKLSKTATINKDYNLIKKLLVDFTNAVVRHFSCEVGSTRGHSRGRQIEIVLS